ncbi:MAG: DUF805 domain-containing protein [Pseudomonadota bacterium]
MRCNTLFFQQNFRYADFQGRSPRSEYWWFMLFYFAVMFTFSFVVSFLGAAMGSPTIVTVGTVIAVIIVLGLIIPNIAVTIRRFHDQDKSGWFILLTFIPYLGALILIVFMCLKGTEGDNRFGPDPLGDVADRFS